MGSTDESANLNEVSTLPGMAKAPYLGTWVMKDKGMDSFTSNFVNVLVFLIIDHKTTIQIGDCDDFLKRTVNP